MRAAKSVALCVLAVVAGVALLAGVARADVGFELEAQDMHLRWFHMKGHTMYTHMAVVGGAPPAVEVWQLQCDDGDPEYVTVQPFPETLAGRTRLCVSAPTLQADAILLNNNALATAPATTFQHHGYAIRGQNGLPVAAQSFSPQVTFAVLLPRFYELLLVQAQPNFMQAGALNTPLLELAAEASVTATFLALPNDAQRSFVLLLAAVRLAGNEQTRGTPNAPKQYIDVMPRTELTRIVALLAPADRANLLAVPAGLARPRACEIADQIIIATYNLGNGLNMRQDDPAAPGNLNLHANLFKTGYAIWKYHATGPTWVGYVQALLGHGGAAPYDPLRYWWTQRLFNRMGNLAAMDTVPPGAPAAQGVIFEARWLRSVHPNVIGQIMMSWFDFHRTFNNNPPLAVPPAAAPLAAAYPRFHQVDATAAGGGMAVAAPPMGVTLHNQVLQNSCNAAHALAAIDGQHAAMQVGRVAGGAFVQTGERAAVLRGRKVADAAARLTRNARRARIARRIRRAVAGAAAGPKKPVVWGQAREIDKAKRNDALSSPAAPWSDDKEKELVKELAKAVAETEKAMGKTGVADTKAPGQRGLGTALPPNWNRFRQLKAHANTRMALQQKLGLTDAQLQQVLSLSAADRAELKARAQAYADADASASADV